MEEKNNLPYIPTGEELEAQTPDFLKEDEWIDVDISNDWLDPTDVYTPPKWTLAFDGVPFAPLGGIHALTGQPGHGKTMTFTQIMVALLKGQYGGLTYELTDEKPHPRVLYIDTEMEKGNTQLVMLRIYSLMGWQFGTRHDELNIIMLRETERAEDRWRKTLKAIYEIQPTVAFIDGLLDVVHDFNKNDECAAIIYKCMKVASYYNISLWCLVHENPGSTKMVGHLGSMLARKVTDVFSTVKNKAEDGSVTFTVKQGKARGKDQRDWKFEVIDGRNNFGEPVQILPPPEIEEEQPFDINTMTEEQVLQCTMLITSRDGMTTRDFEKAIKETFHISTAKADKVMAILQEKGYVHRNESKRYFIPDNTTSDEGIPF